MKLTNNDFAAYVAGLTDNNQHWTAALTIAFRCGTHAQAVELHEMERAATMRGHSLPHEIARRTEITNALLARLPADQADALREAL